MEHYSRIRACEALANRDGAAVIDDLEAAGFMIFEAGAMDRRLFEGDLIERFCAESNWFAGCSTPVPDQEVAATRAFLDLDQPTMDDVIALAQVFQVSEDAARDGTAASLEQLLDLAIRNLEHPFEVHQRWMRLKPFRWTTCNQAVGRALWAWQMLRHGHEPGLNLGFVRAWYGQSLAAKFVMLENSR